MWRPTPLTPALGQQGQEELSELKVSQIYTECSRTARATQRPCLKTKTKRNTINRENCNMGRNPGLDLS